MQPERTHRICQRMYCGQQIPIAEVVFHRCPSGKRTAFHAACLPKPRVSKTKEVTARETENEKCANWGPVPL